MASSFFMLGNIRTTEAKAKELRPYVEKLITRAKNSTPADVRILRRNFSGGVVRKILERAKIHADRRGGYTRIVKTGMRKRDGAKMAIIELVR